MAEPMLETSRIDGMIWIMCPMTPCKFRIMYAAGIEQMALDAMAIHVQGHDLQIQLSHIARIITPPPDPRNPGDKLWTRKKGA